MTLLAFRAARPATRKHLPVEPSHIERGATLNPFFFPSNPPRSSDEATLLVCFSLMFVLPPLAVVIWIHLFS